MVAIRCRSELIPSIQRSIDRPYLNVCKTVHISSAVEFGHWYGCVFFSFTAVIWTGVRHGRCPTGRKPIPSILRTIDRPYLNVQKTVHISSAVELVTDMRVHFFSFHLFSHPPWPLSHGGGNWSRAFCAQSIGHISMYKKLPVSRVPSSLVTDMGVRLQP